MKLDCVISACNMNPLYSDFIPLFIRAWQALYPTVDVKVILISEKIPDALRPYDNHIILFEPIPNISTAFISQYIRLLYPCIMDYKNGVLITDIDMLPMNSWYYTENIRQFSDDQFVYLRSACFEHNEIAMCYNVASPRTWTYIFGISSLDDIRNRLEEVSRNNLYLEGHGNVGWNTDQKDLFRIVLEWNTRTHRFAYLYDSTTGYSRLDRVNAETYNLTPELKDKIRRGYFSDYHCLRPYADFAEINDTIVSLLENTI